MANKRKQIDGELFLSMTKKGYAFSSICNFFEVGAKECSVYVRDKWDCTFRELQKRVVGQKDNGRPRVEIDSRVFEQMCGIWAKEEEIANYFNCSVDSLENWCNEFYGKGFSESYKKFSAKGIISLRQAQLKTAVNGNSTMQIWLGKQHLGQKEHPEDMADHGTFPQLMESILAMNKTKDEGDK